MSPKNPHFYAVIIGTEILNGRRVDKHFEFIRDVLKERGWELYGSFIVKDDKVLMAELFNFIKKDSNSVMFSFGGIGSTPDDLTRQIAADAFGDGELYKNKKFAQNIVEKFGDDAYPHRIHMADLPKDAKLLKNPINNMSGFYLKERYFFTPGFPQMAHPMVEEALKSFYKKGSQKYRLTLTAKCSENLLIGVMKTIPEHIELSSLPMFINKKRQVTISLLSFSKNETEKWFKHFEDFLILHNISYVNREA